MSWHAWIVNNPLVLINILRYTIFLCRCVWESTWGGENVVHLGHVKIDVNKVVPNTISHDPLAAHVIQKLRDIAGKPQPAFRKRVKSVVYLILIQIPYYFMNYKGI